MLDDLSELSNPALPGVAVGPCSQLAHVNPACVEGHVGDHDCFSEIQPTADLGERSNERRGPDAAQCRDLVLWK